MAKKGKKKLVTLQREQAASSLEACEIRDRIHRNFFGGEK